MNLQQADGLQVLTCPLLMTAIVGALKREDVFAHFHHGTDDAVPRTERRGEEYPPLTGNRCG